MEKSYKVSIRTIRLSVFVLAVRLVFREFSDVVLRCLPSFNYRIPTEEIKRRLDLRCKLCCSVDPPGCKDIDDALSCEVLQNSNFLVRLKASYYHHSIEEQGRKTPFFLYLTWMTHPLTPLRGILDSISVWGTYRRRDPLRSPRYSSWSRGSREMYYCLFGWSKNRHVTRIVNYRPLLACVRLRGPKTLWIFQISPHCCLQGGSRSTHVFRPMGNDASGSGFDSFVFPLMSQFHCRFYEWLNFHL